MLSRAWVLWGLFVVITAHCGSDETRRDQYYGTDAAVGYEGPSVLVMGGAGASTDGSGGRGGEADGGLGAGPDDRDAEPAIDGGTLDLRPSDPF